MATLSVKTKRYPLIPEEECKCIWMTTGLISYKLCDRQFQCEICPFDQAIKNEEMGEGESPEVEQDRMEGSLNSDPSAWINGSIFYHPNHCWAKVESPEKVRIGMDYLLTRLIMNVNVIILPQPGSFAGQGECYAHIIQEDYILPVFSPLSGLVQMVNPRLSKEPELITADPRGDGWLMIIKPENLENDLRNLLFGKKALSWYQREEREIIARTDLMLKQNAQALGPTMQDGGVIISCLQDVINLVTAKQRAQILDFSISRSRKKN